jgi:hypothetical protein
MLFRRDNDEPSSTNNRAEHDEPLLKKARVLNDDPADIKSITLRLLLTFTEVVWQENKDPARMKFLSETDDASIASPIIESVSSISTLRQREKLPELPDKYESLWQLIQDPKFTKYLTDKAEPTETNFSDDMLQLAF